MPFTPPRIPMRFAAGEDPHDDYFAEVVDSAQAGTISVKHMGCNNLFITDGETNLLIDPFFSRPDVIGGTGPRLDDMIEPNVDIIRGTLEHVGITRVDAIIVTHSHWDHALDIAEVWRYFAETNNGEGVPLYGTRSSINIMIGAWQRWQQNHIDMTNIPDVRQFCTEISEHLRETVGNFTITFIDGAHSPLPLVGDDLGDCLHPGVNIQSPLRPPALVRSYREGGTYSVLFEHSLGNMLNQGSANYIEGYYTGLFRSGITERIEEGGRWIYPSPDVLLLGVGGINIIFGGFRLSTRRLRRRIKENFYSEVVETTRPDRVLFTHWDSYGKEECTLDHPLKWYYDAYEAMPLFRRQNYYMYHGRRTRVWSGRQNTVTIYQPIVEFLPLLEYVTVLPVS